MGVSVTPLPLGDVVVDDRAVEIIDAPIERPLGQLGRLHDPERFDMRNVVEHQPADRQRAQVIESRWPGQVGQLAAFRDERERDEAVERRLSAGERLLLMIAELSHVAHTLFGPLDVTVEYGRVRGDAELVGRSMYVKPALLPYFVLIGLVVHTIVEDLRPTSGHAVQTGLAKLA